LLLRLALEKYKKLIVGTVCTVHNQGRTSKAKCGCFNGPWDRPIWLVKATAPATVHRRAPKRSQTGPCTGPLNAAVPGGKVGPRGVRRGLIKGKGGGGATPGQPKAGSQHRQVRPARRQNYPTVTPAHSLLGSLCFLGSTSWPPRHRRSAQMRPLHLALLSHMALEPFAAPRILQ